MNGVLGLGGGGGGRYHRAKNVESGCIRTLVLEVLCVLSSNFFVYYNALINTSKFPFQKHLSHKIGHFLNPF